MSHLPTVVHLTTVDVSLAKLLLTQLVAFKAAGYEVIGVSAPGPYTEEIRDAGIRHVALAGSTRASDIRADLAAARDFAGICRRLRPDIVHTHNPKPGIYGRVCARFVKVPVVVNTVHGLYAQPSDTRRRRVAVYGLERVAATCSDAELVQNVEDLSTLRRLGIPRHKLHLLGNGVDLSRFDPDEHASVRDEVRAELGLGGNEIVVGLVGRLVWEKGYAEVFAAARRITAKHPEVRFVVVGPSDTGKGDSIHQAELDRASAESGVRFVGMRDDVERLYTAFDLYVLASHREGFPRSAMEAAAMGLPIVATNIRGCRQVVDQDRTGLLVPVRDPRALGDAIMSLVANEPRRLRMGREGRRKALKEFDDAQQVDTTLRIYGMLLRRWTLTKGKAL